MRGIGLRYPPLLVLLGMNLSLWAPSGASAQGPRRPENLTTYAAGIFTAEPSSTEGALTLLLPIGPRGIGMGRAMSTASGPEAVFWNPAGLAKLESGGFFVYRGNHLAGDATGFSLVLTKEPLGTLGISYQLLDLGGQELTDENNNVVGSFSVRDHLGIVSLGMEIIPRLDAGLNFKIFQSRYTCRGQCIDAGVTGTTYAVDAGIQSQPVDDIPLRFGLLLAHLGPSLQLINSEQADPLPTRLRAAASYEVLRHFSEMPNVELWLTTELEDHWRDLGDPNLYLGGELVAGEGGLFMIRAGYGQQELGQSPGASVGLGLRYERFDLGLAKRFSSSSVDGNPEPVHISFGVFF